MDQAQRQQLESLAKDNLRHVVFCECGQIYGYKPDLLINKPVNNWLIEVGINCPYCKLFHRAYWMNSELITLRGKIGEKPNRKQARYFTHQFTKFQNRMRLKNARGAP